MLKKWAVYVAIFAGAVLALACLVALAAWNITGFGPAYAKANQQYKDWEANGLPVTQDQLFLTPAPADDDNAAALLQEAFADLDRKGLDRIPLELAGINSYDHVIATTYVESCKSSLELVHRAAEKPTCRFERDWDLGVWVLFPEFGDMKGMAKRLSYEAQVKASLGDGAGAARSIATGRKLAFFCFTGTYRHRHAGRHCDRYHHA